MMKPIATILTPLAAAALLTACNSGGTGSSFTNPTTCGVPSNTVMAYPKNGASKVPASVTSIYIVSAATNLNNGNYNSAIQPPNGLPFFYGSNFTAVNESQVPVPHAHPNFANPQWYQSVIGPISSGSTYVIGFNINNQICNPAGLGQFTTQ